ncbi:PorP/SprF family type IX secretion system membrane protein [Pontibacter akesuensis]|uniref:Type IX secretion system membrane protein, PorP/SprF family n=1 Tax=Pontibacter akesuensis TaxID=388950 RepID=A0A1I7KIW7_9BACT|nr:PorP/SprF family type IX secretion system membrane protein [Pontibacter akesuensis]GHA80301.1 membrane protein [Pontibacter akesuensis]SFU97371.1 type IX secretion system membrane protein, PorP/SprF family [Pontibacter akesuensis]
MKKFILAACVLMLSWDVQAQSVKSFANFSQYKHYFNPSLTGHEGSVIRSLYRNQWTGFEDAPKTIMASAEISTSLFGRASGDYQFRRDDRLGSGESMGAKHALGLVVLRDQFGPLKETQLALSYGSGVRLSEELQLRWGVAFTFANQRLDANSLVVDQPDDPQYTGVMADNNSSSKGDINLGLSLASANYYVGYAAQNVTGGRVLSSGYEVLENANKLRHQAQAGFRKSVSQQIGFTVNGIYHYMQDEKSVAEAQVKAVYNNMFWVGAGYRDDLAYNLAAGARLKQFHIGYAYEMPVQDASAINKATNEITLSYVLTPFKDTPHRRQLTIW